MGILKNGKHELFAQKWHELDNKTKAYKIAYPGSLKWKEATINKRASELSLTREVTGRYNELQEQAGAKHGVTIEKLLRELEEIKELAMRAETPQCSAAVSSVMSKAKLVGLDVTKIEVSAAQELTPWGSITASED